MLTHLHKGFHRFECADLQRVTPDNSPLKRQHMVHPTNSGIAEWLDGLGRKMPAISSRFKCVKVKRKLVLSQRLREEGSDCARKAATARGRQRLREEGSDCARKAATA